MNTKNSDPASSTLAIVRDVLRCAGTLTIANAGIVIHRADSETVEIAKLYESGLLFVVSGHKKIAAGDGVGEMHAGTHRVIRRPLVLTEVNSMDSDGNSFISIFIPVDSGALSVFEDNCIGPLISIERQLSCEGVRKTDSKVAHLVARIVESATLGSEGDKITVVIKRALVEAVAMPRLDPPIGHRLTGIAKIEQAVSWINSNYRDRVKLSDLAALIKLPISSFHREFRKHVGLTPIGYLKKKRLQKAHQLMVENGCNARSASSAVGYGSASQFSREYRREFGSPPITHVCDVRASRVAAEITKEYGVFPNSHY